jgi:hypothetical protein
VESWGYEAQAEIVGIPRFDGLLNRSPRVRGKGEPFVILVLTAKCAGFNAEQLQRASRSLRDLKAWLDAHPRINGTPIRSVWRITQGLEKEVGVDNSLKDTTGDDLAQMLTKVDAVITTPSTSLLEGMLQQLPVAMLDYNNCPHYVPAAWRITAWTHFDQVVPELVNPPLAKMHYQQHLLQDSLECHSPALPRLVQLIERMHELAQRSIREDGTVNFPNRILQIAVAPPAAEAIPLDYARLFPGNPAFANADVRLLQTEVADLRVALQTVRDVSAQELREVQIRFGIEPVSLRKRLRRAVRRVFPKRDRNQNRAA